MIDLVIRFAADGVLLLIVAVGTYALLAIPNSQKLRSYARIAMAGLTALLFAKLIGSMWQPDAARPFVEMGVQAKAAYLDNAGFPSDHVLFASAISFAVFFETRKRKIAYVLFGLTAIVAVGRVVALVHTPLDVAGGLFFAGLGALWYFTDEKPKLRKKSKKLVS